MEKNNFQKGREELWLLGYRSESKDLVAEGNHKLEHNQLSKGSLLHTLPPDDMTILHKEREEKPCPSSTFPFGKFLAQLTILTLCFMMFARLHPFGGEMFTSHGQKFSYILTCHTCGWGIAQAPACFLQHWCVKSWPQILCNMMVMVPLECFMDWLCLPSEWFLM